MGEMPTISRGIVGRTGFVGGGEGGSGEGGLWYT